MCPYLPLSLNTLMIILEYGFKLGNPIFHMYLHVSNKMVLKFDKTEIISLENLENLSRNNFVLEILFQILFLEFKFR